MGVGRAHDGLIRRFDLCIASAILHSIALSPSVIIDH